MLNKLMKVTMVAAMTFTSCLGSVNTLLANEISNGKVTVQKGSNSVTIGNNSITRTFDTTANKLTTSEINNLMGDSNFVPKEGSEEFLINLLGDTTKVAYKTPEQALTSLNPKSAKTTVSVNASSEIVEGSKMEKGFAIDKKADTYWASTEEGLDKAFFEVDLGAKKEISKIKYTPRTANGSTECTGRIETIVLTFDDEKHTVVEETFSDLNAKVQTITLPTPVMAQKVKITAKKSHHWQEQNKNKAMNIAELDILGKDEASLIHAAAKPAAAWTVTGTSVQTDDGRGYGALIDQDPSTHYHSAYKTENSQGTRGRMPVDLVLDRGEGSNAIEFQSFGYRPRGSKGDTNGNVTEYELYVGNDKDTLFNKENKKVSSEYIYVDGTYTNNQPNFLYTAFDEKQNGRYVGFRVLKGYGGNFAAGTEIDLFEEPFTSLDLTTFKNGNTIKTSDLELASDPVIEATTANINGKDKTGQMITFNFKPYTHELAGTVNIAQKVVMYDGDHFMRKFLEINFSNKTQRIDYIDGEHLVLTGSDDRWTIPHVGGVVAMDEAKANLGQPIYVNGMFLGYEFPATDKQVVENLGRMRYFTGKNFEDFKRDNQLTKEDGKYVSWQTVLGASPVANSKANNMDIVKQSFFNYIDSIATPTEFRIQYNSWFDNMMRITDENILSSFSAVDKHLSATGVRPLDSYVVDDGWNIYRKTAGTMNGQVDIERNGPVNEVNTTGFWQFNSKFPNQLTPSSDLVQNFGSNFGVWVGPRGGYNYQGTLADIIQTGVMIDGKKVQYGSSAGGSIDVADQRYVDKFKEMAIQWMRDYKVNYWKWDGFADGGQYGAFKSGRYVAGYDENHHHMYGGVDNMYHVTDLWEKWIVLMKDVRDEAAKLNINNLWISLTCYVNPSPWYLQWANSVWIQCVADRGERTNSNRDLNNKMDNMLTYRDGAYYDFVVNHEFQFPLANLYNHDPIYGKEGTGIDANSMDGEEFRNYMFMQGTRGTAFWELYYSDSIFNEEKYLINADFLEWEEKNFDMIRNAIMIGGTPSSTATLTGGTGGNAGKQEAYGFAGFKADGSEGIISMRNPAATEKTIKFKLDATIGAKTAHGTTYNVTKDHAFTTNGEQGAAVISNTYTQGQEISITLKPGETYVLHFNTKEDKTSPVVNKLYIKDANTVQVQTSEHVSEADFDVTVAGQKVNFEAKTYRDLRTFDLTLAQPLTNGQEVVVTAKAGKDNANNQLAGNVSLKFYEDGLVASKDLVSGDATVSTADNSVEGKNGFAISMEVSTERRNVELVKQGNEYALGIDAEGHAYFELHGVRTTSKSVIATGEQYVLTGVKENNGIIKLYVDGKVNSSKYEKANKDYAVKAGNIVADAKNVKAANVEVYNKALGYDEVPTLPLDALVKKVEAERNNYTKESWNQANLNELVSSAKEVLAQGDKAAMQEAYNSLYAGYKKLVPSVVNLALNKEASAQWVGNVDQPVTNSGSPVSNAFDGKFNDTNKYAIVGKDGVKNPVYIEVDLGAEYALNRVHLYRYWQDGRTYDSTAVVVSKDKSFKDKEVLYYSGDSDKFELGEQPKQQVYAEPTNGSGKELYNGKDVTARYVRLYVSGRKQASPTENHIVELQVFGKQSDPYKLSDLEALIKDAKVLEADKQYTETSVAQLSAQIKNAEAVVAAVKAGTQSDQTIGYVLNAKDALADAIANLEVKKADVTLSNLSLSLADYIGVNYYFDFSDAVLNDANAYVEFTREDQSTVKYMVSEIKENTKVVNGKTLYRASVPMAARQMSEAIKGKVVYGENNVVELENMSVQGYADVIYKNEGNKYSAEAVAAVKAMLNYGTAAQMNFKNKVKQLANAILSADDQKVVVDDSVFAQYKSNKEGSVTGLDYFGTSVLLKSKTGFAHYFTLTNGSIEDYTFTVGGKEVQPQMKNGKYFVEFSDIYAKNLADSYELVVTKDNESMSIAFSVFAYANIVVKGDYSDELKAVVRSMYPYYEAALAYSKTVK